MPMRNQSIDPFHNDTTDNDNRLPPDLLSVQKPARYTGGEVNAVQKEPRSFKLRMALAFPDVYETAMSHLGLKILYSILNERPDTAAERVFAPWPDMETLLRERSEPLTGLETGTPLSEFDIVGFSLQYELCATTVLQILELGRIPIRAADRTAEDPLVVAGGPVVFNPAPWSRFFDAFAVGEAEDLIHEMVDAWIGWKDAGGSREDLLWRLKGISGVYVPSLHTPGERVKRRIVPDLNAAPMPSRPVVPACETVHDRIALEIARGCTRGCRFCQAGMIYRPVRERNPAAILDSARKALESTGWDELGLLSLSSGDYSCIGPLVSRIADEFGPSMTAVSLPSLRTETLDDRMAEAIRTVRKTGFTLAPEAGTERLRRVINKGNTEEDLERAVRTAFEHGWQSVKLYFMIGLPHETDEDLAGVVNLIRKAAGWAKGGKITASISTFVPKSHTPFQWAEQISPDETLRKRDFIKRHFRKGRAKLKFHDHRTTFLEGVLARGDERIADVIEGAYERGARFDGWEECLKFDVWMDAFRECGLDPTDYLRARGADEPLPWDRIDSGVDRDYLLNEWKNAVTGAHADDCRFDECRNCGVCDFYAIMPRLTDASLDLVAPRAPDGDTSPETEDLRRFRLRYAKTFPASMLGHHDLARSIHRAFRRAGLPLDHSKGFHPHPKLRFSPPLSLGVESSAEYVDFDLIGERTDVKELTRRLEKTLPRGINPLELMEIPLNTPPISGRIRSVTYEISSYGSLSQEEVERRLADFRSSPTYEIARVKKGKTKKLDLKRFVKAIDFRDSILTFTITIDSQGSVNPFDAVSAFLGVGRENAKLLPIRKIDVELEPAAHEMGARSYEQ